MDRVVSNADYRSYQTRMATWNLKASVRAKPMRTFLELPRGLPFSPELIPVLGHPAVIARGEATAHTIQAQKLFTYLGFTEHLERKTVIPACTLLAHAEAPFAITRELQRDASKIVVDEAHHAECAGDLTDQMISTVGVGPYRPRVPSFLNKLACVLADAPIESKRLILLTFASVSETLITGALVKVPSDLAVDATIREVIRDHAVDEARHHACFSDVIGVMWQGIDQDARDLCGPLFAKFIVDFLSPDLQAELDWLEAAGFSSAEAGKILDETHIFLPPSLSADAAPTIAVMKRHGLLNHEATNEALAQAGLL